MRQGRRRNERFYPVTTWTGAVQDPFVCTWDLATHREDVPPDEMKRRGEEFFRNMGGGQ